MTDAAIIAGNYADFKLVKTRSTCQLIIEIPIEQAEAAIRVFGIPMPGHEIPVAIARLEPNVVPHSGPLNQTGNATGDAEDADRHTIDPNVVPRTDAKHRSVNATDVPQGDGIGTSPDPVKSARSKAAYAAGSEGERATARAAMYCNDMMFKDWARQNFDGYKRYPDVASWLRAMTHVKSRSEYATNTAGLEAFLSLETLFLQAAGRMAVPR